MINLKEDALRCGEPILKLIPLEKTAVHTPTFEDYNELLRVYELGNWRWCSGILPTEFSCFSEYNKETCVLTENSFKYKDKAFYLEENWDVISLKEFYKKQKITPKILEEINKYFENIK